MHERERKRNLFLAALLTAINCPSTCVERVEPEFPQKDSNQETLDGPPFFKNYSDLEALLPTPHPWQRLDLLLFLRC